MPTSCNDQTTPCKFAPLGCPALFARTRPQSRLQHEAACLWTGVVCQWGEQGCRDITPLKDLGHHLATKHGHLLRCVSQEDGGYIKLSQVQHALLITRISRMVHRYYQSQEKHAGQTALVAAVLLLSSSGQYTTVTNIFDEREQ